MSSRSAVRRFVQATAVWCLALGGGWLLAILALSGGWPTREVPDFAAMVLAFSVFAGGSAVGDRWGLHRLDLRPLALSAVLAVSVWYVMAFVTPELRYSLGERPVGEFVDGPLTPGVWKELATTPSAVGVSRAQVDYQISRPRVAGLFLVLNALFGWATAANTIGLRPGPRRRTRWALGLGGVFVFVAMDTWAVASVMGEDDGSGALVSWLVLGPHLMAVLILSGLRAWRG